MVATSPPVSFSYADFIAAYPQFVNCSEPQLLVFFQMGDAFFSNDTCNPAFNSGTVVGQTQTRMTQLAYMLTAHIAWLFAPRDTNGNPSATGTQPAPGTVGQITSASQGSVSVSLASVAAGGANELASWFAQTPFGFMFWQATSQYRTFRYVPSVRPNVSSVFPLFPMRGRGGGGGFWN